MRRNKLIHLIFARYVTIVVLKNKNIKLLSLWKAKNPDCKRSDSHLSDKYSHLVIEAMGGSGENDDEKANKIIRKIAKEVTIKKQN